MESDTGVDIDPSEPWQSYAACGIVDPDTNTTLHDPETFFPRRSAGSSTEPAKRICDGCPVRLNCLKMGIREPSGVWGGLSEQERRGAWRAVKAGVTYEKVLADAIRRRASRRRLPMPAPVVVRQPTAAEIQARALRLAATNTTPIKGAAHPTQLRVVGGR